MKTIVVLLLTSLGSTPALTQHLSFKFGTAFRRSDLDVRWNLTANELPPEVWTYRLLPRTFPTAFVSDLVATGGFSAKDLVRSNADEMLFRNPKSFSFWVSTRFGTIDYQRPHHYGPTNLAEHVPKMTELPELATNFLRDTGISFGDLTKRPDGTPDLGYWEPFKVYFVNHAFITNIEFRAVDFRRAVDGAKFVGNGTGGDGHVEFGEYGRPSKIRLSWRNLRRDRVYPTATSETLIEWIRQGKAVQNMIRTDAEPIDWRTAKSLTVTTAKLCYYGGSPTEPSDWLIPFVALWTTVDRGHGTIDVEIDCPLIDESSLHPKTPSH